MNQIFSPIHILFFCFLIISPLLSSAQNDPIRALPEIIKARELFKQSDTEFHQGFYDKSLKSGHQTLQHVYRAEKLLIDSPVKQVKFTTDIMKAHGYNSLGIIYQNLEDLSNANNYLKEATVLYKKLELKREQAFALTNFGMGLLQEENYLDALEKLQQSKVIFRDLLDRKSRSTDSIYLFGHNQFYINYINSCLNKDSLSRRNASIEMANAINFLYRSSHLTIERQQVKYKLPGIILQAAKLDLEKNIFADNHFILNYLNKAIHILEEIKNSNQSELGQLYAFKAIYLLRKKEHLSEEALASLNRSWNILCGEENRTSIKAALKEGTLSIKKIKDFIFALSNSAKFNFEVYQKNRNTKKLIIAYQDVLVAVLLMDELITKYTDDYNLEVLLNRHATIYQTAATIISKKYQITKEYSTLKDLLLISEKQKSYVLRKAVNQSLLIDNLDLAKKQKLLVGDSLLRILKVIDSSILGINLSENTDSLLSYIYKERIARVQYKDWLSELKKETPELFRLLHDNEVTTLPLIKEKIRYDQAAIVEYILTDDQVITLLITPTMDTVLINHRSPKTDKILQRYHQSLVKSFSSEAYRGTAFEVYQFLFQEVNEVLSKQNIDRVYLVPDGLLNGISFNAMLTAADKNSWYNQLSYLLFDYQFSRHFSATSLLQNFKRSNKFQKISFGAFVPDYKNLPSLTTNCDTPPLKNNLESAKKMATNFEEAKVFSSATVRDFENNLEKFSILQLDMHGCVNFKDPNFSSLIFTYENDTIPFELNLGFIYNKTIPAELVVLNACDTGNGRLRNGEGITSFGRAFFYAGCKSVIMSLWDANNFNSQEITKEFYDNLSKKKMKKDEALTKAIRQYVRKTPTPPVNWANLIIIGNLDPLSLGMLNK